MPPPAVGGLPHGAGFIGLGDQCQQIQQNLTVLAWLARFPQGMPEGIAQVQTARGVDLTRHLRREGDSRGGDTERFHFPLNQTDRLVAQASGRGEQHHVHLFGHQFRGNLRRGVLLEGLQVG